MSEFTRINLNANLIRYDTGKALLISMPHNSDYDGYAFWFPKALTDEKGEYCIKLSIPSDFTFKMEKRSKDKRIIGSESLNAEDMIEQLSEHQQRLEKEDVNPCYLIVNEPKKRPVEDVKIPEDLQNNGQ